MIQKKKKKKRDRKEGLLDLLEKGKQKTSALQTWKAFDVPVFFLSIIVVFFKKKIISHVIDSIKFSKIIPQVLSKILIYKLIIFCAF